MVLKTYIYFSKITKGSYKWIEEVWAKILITVVSSHSWLLSASNASFLSEDTILYFHPSFFNYQALRGSGAQEFLTQISW